MLKLLRLQLSHSFQRIPTRSISSKEKIQGKRISSTKETSKQHNENPGYVILRAIKDDFDSILNLMHEAYYPNEPLCSSLNIKPNRVIDEHAIKSLNHGISLVARCKSTKDILGVIINQVTHPWDPDTTEALIRNIACEKTRHLLRFYVYVQRKPDLWRKYGVQQIFEVLDGCVRSDQRNKNLGFVLLKESMTLAENCGYTLFRVDCSNLYTAKMCQKITGMQLVQEIPYNTYLDQNNKPIFNPPYPHTELKTYVHNSSQGNYGNEPIQLMVNALEKP